MDSKKAPKKTAPKPAAAEEAAPPLPSPSPKRRVWYIALLSAGVILLGAATALAVIGVADGWEQKIFSAINNVDLPVWVTEQVAKPVSNAVWGIVGLVILLLLFPKYRLLAWQYAVAAGSAYVLVYIIEHLVGRARPIGLESYEVVARATQGGPGFPSGHVAVIAALGLTIWPLVSWPWRVLILIFIGAEAWSRIFLGVHAPLDVVGGMAAAMVVVAIIHLTPAKIRKFFRISA